MNWFSKLFKKESKAGAAIVINNNQAQWSKRNYAAFAKEGYRLNVVAYQAINKTAKAVSQIPWRVVNKNGSEVFSPIVEAINKPNPMQSRKEWIEAAVGFYRISGNMYLEKTVDTRGNPIEFYALRPDRMTVKLGSDGMAESYTYSIGNAKVVWSGDESERVRHIKTFNPLDDVYGMSPIEAAAFSIDQHNESNNWLQSLLQNGAAPSGALVSEDELSDDDFNKLKSEIDEKYGGGRNAGRPLILEGGMDWKQIGLSPQNMSIIETKLTSARDIALALEVPPLLLNIQGDSTYSNYKEARLAFYEETIIPLAEHIVDEFNIWCEDALKGARVELDLDAVPAIMEKRQVFWDMANSSSDLTINEKREMKGYPPVEGGDTVYIDGNKLPINIDLDSEEPEIDNAESEDDGER